MRNLLILILFFTTLQCALGAVITNQSTPVYNNTTGQKQSIATLPANSQVTLLKTNLQNGYSLVKTSSGQQGWLLTTRLQQKAVQQHSPGLLTRVWDDISGKHAAASANKSAVVSSTTKPVAENVTPSTTKSTKVTAKLNQHRMQQTLSKETLKNQVVQLQQQVATLQAEQHQEWYWFIWGAVVALLGLFVGMFLGWRRQKQRARSLFH